MRDGLSCDEVKGFLHVTSRLDDSEFMVMSR